MKPAVLDLTREEWTAAGLAIIDGQPAGIRFTADDIRPHLPQPHHPNAFGALFMTAKARGLITRAGHATSRTRTRRHGEVKIWERTHQ